MDSKDEELTRLFGMLADGELSEPEFWRRVRATGQEYPPVKLRMLRNRTKRIARQARRRNR